MVVTTRSPELASSAQGSCSTPTRLRKSVSEELNSP
jgi:hypothetical protein